MLWIWTIQVKWLVIQRIPGMGFQEGKFRYSGLYKSLKHCANVHIYLRIFKYIYKYYVFMFIQYKYARMQKSKPVSYVFITQCGNAHFPGCLFWIASDVRRYWSAPSTISFKLVWIFLSHLLIGSQMEFHFLHFLDMLAFSTSRTHHETCFSSFCCILNLKMTCLPNGKLILSL